jgi:catechol 2,3-dioxygenase-like lactoylglutathione lyase family enzyme
MNLMESTMKIEHVAIWTHDLERLRIFYETYFGTRVGAKYHNRPFYGGGNRFAAV